jgi:hypothetical protein
LNFRGNGLDHCNIHGNPLLDAYTCNTSAGDATNLASSFPCQ